jgi:hypothetical protein
VAPTPHGESYGQRPRATTYCSLGSILKRRASDGPRPEVGPSLSHGVWKKSVSFALLWVIASACSEPTDSTAADDLPFEPTGSGAVLVGAGDIASCGEEGAELTARLLDTIPGTVFTTGDNAYPDGTAGDFSECYAPTWGRHRDRTRPAPGNHDYHTTDAEGYFDYFGSAAGTAGQGYYSYDLGGWHIISLNSEIDMDTGSAQEEWLRTDLGAHPGRCTLAYWHKPRFSSGSRHGSSGSPAPLWEALYESGAEVILNGHEHLYERFAPQSPDGSLDRERGIQQFIVGSGGASPYGFSTPLPNSQARNDSDLGVLKLTLYPEGYTWEFVPTEAGGFADTGAAPCHE